MKNVRLPLWLFPFVTSGILLFSPLPSAQAAEGYASIQWGGYVPLSAASDLSNASPFDFTANIGYEIGGFFAPEFNLEYLRSGFKRDVVSTTSKLDIVSLSIGPRVTLHMDFIDLYAHGGLGVMFFDSTSLDLLEVQVGAGGVYRMNDWVSIGPYFRFHHTFNSPYDTQPDDSEVTQKLAGGGDPEWINIGLSLQVSLASMVDRRRYEAPTYPGGGGR
ncbi:MAG: hypothetical protein D6795_08735 [Deltaproteobacteria bacterium]|nr:MAG: hypothetical protein D6795_08735 [Deltaproteobacteria bacterium]